MSVYGACGRAECRRTRWAAAGCPRAGEWGRRRRRPGDGGALAERAERLGEEVGEQTVGHAALAERRLGQASQEVVGGCELGGQAGKGAVPTDCGGLPAPVLLLCSVVGIVARQ